MIKTKIVDNWLDSDFSDFLSNYFLRKYPHFYNEMSNSGKDEDNIFYSSDIDHENPIAIFLMAKLRKLFMVKLIVHRIHINIQHPSMNGSFHDDPNDITAVYFVTKSLHNSGELVIGDEIIDFKKNRLVCFDSKILHKGLAPAEGVRISLSFNLEVMNKDNK
mgnify:CR=1 FL=1|tara:strand:+ start:7619 stop:8104 length:486 start_codon:yes stop_codon:yes gene_type:complete